MKTRLPYLDYLRGLAALGIMLYHLILWGVGSPSTDTFIARLGLYGVSVFYVLSYLSYRFFELPIMIKGKQLLSRKPKPSMQISR